MEALTTPDSRLHTRIVDIFTRIKRMDIIAYGALYSSYIVTIMKFASRMWIFVGFSDR